MACLDKNAACDICVMQKHEHAKFWPKQHVPSDTSKQHILATHPSATCPSAFRARHAQGKRSCGLCGMYACAHLWHVWRMCVVVVVVVVYKCAYCMCSVATDETSRPHHVARKGHICTHACRVTQPLNFKQNDVQKDSRHLITLYTVTRPPNTCVTNFIVAYSSIIQKGFYSCGRVTPEPRVSA